MPLFDALDLRIRDLYRFLREVKFSVDMDMIETNKRDFVRDTLLEITHVESIVKFHEF